MTEQIFCKVYTAFYGEPIDKVEQIVEHRFTGKELMEFCEFFASQSKPQEIEWMSEPELKQKASDLYQKLYDRQSMEGRSTSGMIFDLAKDIQSELQTRIKPVDTKTVKELKEEIAGHEKMRKRAAEVVVDLSNKLSKAKEELEQIKTDTKTVDAV